MTPEEEEEENRFFESLKRKEGQPAPEWALPQDNLLEAMDQVPLFMKNTPASIEDNVPLAALQSLMYDNTPDENAQGFYDNAVDAFADYEKSKTPLFLTNALTLLENALSQSPQDTVLLSNIYELLARVQFCKQNYGKSRDAAKKAFTLDDTKCQAKGTFIEALEALGYFEEALKYIQSQSSAFPDQYKRIAGKLAEKTKRQSLLAAQAEKHQKNLEKRYLKTLKEEESILQVYMSPDHIRSLPRLSYDSAEDEFYVPIVFLYPPYGTFDVIGPVSEFVSIEEQLEIMFGERAPWDADHHYKSNTILSWRMCMPLPDGKYEKIDQKMTLHALFMTTQRVALFGDSLVLLVFPPSGFQDQINKLIN